MDPQKLFTENGIYVILAIIFLLLIFGFIIKRFI